MAQTPVVLTSPPGEASRLPGAAPAGEPSAPVVTASLLALLAWLCWACFFNGIEILYPADKTEALQLEIARQMAVGGDWITPGIDGRPYFDKPPLPYWIGGLLLRSFPQQVWLPRLGAALFGCVGVSATLVLCRFGSRDGASRRGLFRALSAAAILALMPVYQAFARIALHDIYLTASTSVALTAFFLLSQARSVRRPHQWLSGWLVGGTLGVGVLAKGLLGLALPGATAAVFLLVAGGDGRRFLTHRFALALLLGLLLVALPWHLAAWQSQGSVFVAGYLGRTHLSRFTSQLDDHAGPWFYYLPVYLAITFPWGIAGLAALIQTGCLNVRHWCRQAHRQPLPLFCAIWIVATVGLFSLASTKLPHYILSALPPTAIAAAHFFWPLQPARPARDRISRMLLIVTAGLLLLLALALHWLPALLMPITADAPAFSLALQTLLVSVPVIVGLTALGLSGAWAAWRGPRPHLLLGALWAASILAFLLVLAPPLLQLYRDTYQAPRLELADRALREARAGEAIQVVGKSWYSLKIRTDGRAEILRRGKAFGSESREPRATVCTGPRLLLGPTHKVLELTSACAPGQLLILQQHRAADLTLARLQPTQK
ncbi:MAG: ArnT family glycosyltransferase [Prochlorococcaceae cyanobacterium]